MRPAIVHSMVPAAPPVQFPIRIEQKASNIGPLMMLVLVTPALAALLLPFLLLGKAWAANPSIHTWLAEHPRSAVQLVLAFLFWAVLFAVPIKALTDRLMRSRRIEITESLVSVHDRSLLSTSQWTEPLRAYPGISHRIRSSLSGVRHELVLNHQDPSKSVLIALAPHFTDAEVAQVKSLFAGSQSPAHELQRRLKEAYAVAGPGQFAALRSEAA